MAIAAALFTCAACGGGNGDGGDAAIVDAGAADAQPADAGPTRSFYLASTGAQIRLDRGLVLVPADLAEDVDLISIHNDFYGLPWEAFETGAEPPAPWVAAMAALRDDAVAAGKPVFLSLQLVGGTSRRYLADRAVDDGGQLAQESNWSVECYDFATEPDAASKQAAYVAYVDWMVREFDPMYVNVAIEMNLFMGCGDAWDALVDVERAAYDAAKLAKPDVIAFPSIQIDGLYGYIDCPAPMSPSQCYEANYARLARLARDRFAISTYPHLQDFIPSPAGIPSDWFTRAADRGGERLVVAETGWIATDAAGTWIDGSCLTALASDPEVQAAYFDRLVGDAQAAGADLVTWWSNRDLIPEALMTDCPCDFDATWCSLIDLFRMTGGDDPTAQFYGEMLLKIFGTMGIRDYDGAPRSPIHERWQATAALPVAPR